MAVGTGHGASLTWSTIGQAHPVRSVQFHDETAPPIDTSHLGTGANRTYVKGDMYDIGAISLELLWDSELEIITKATTDTVRVTLPKRASGTAAAGYLEGTAYVSAWNLGNLESGEVQIARVSLQWTGAPTWTDEA
jgi:hypothetical protein